ncbi:hypothetical protein [Lacibacter sediminis]|uniref:Uncharacterized protein n=1 Tax=Lacibacter sediminis TaxID=2760713 RepID=A0A7G5XIY5_9BACT|nr:hypothetical protein [Lacibacter sediminis]QNA45438.1 hypothetical protein H4075_04340 [Lacibacter sediminis]
MKHFLFLLFFLHLILTTAAQYDRTIFLGEDMMRSFRSDIIKLRFWDSAVSFLFDTRLTVLYDTVITTSEKYNRLGLILPSKSTEKTTYESRLKIDNDIDSCIVNYKHDVNVVRHGKSLLFGIINLFSKPEERSPQEEPYYANELNKAWGTINYGSKTSPFLLINKNKLDLKNKGWLILNNDSLTIKPINTYKNRKGKIKKSLPGGMFSWVLKKGDTIVAAIDGYIGNNIAYISRDLSEEDRIIITAFIFVFCRTNPV